MPTCPLCSKPTGPDTDHRSCVLELFKTNKIQSVKDWEALCKPKTIVKQRIRVRIMKD